MDLNVLPAWIQGYTGKGVVVSIVDDGVLYTLYIAGHVSCIVTVDLRLRQ